jgi:hypothetical protein
MQRTRLRGLELSGKLEPSHSLIDLIGQIVEDSSSRRQLDKQQIRNAARVFEFEASKYPYEEEVARPANYSPMRPLALQLKKLATSCAARREESAQSRPPRQFLGACQQWTVRIAYGYSRQTRFNRTLQIPEYLPS